MRLFFASLIRDTFRVRLEAGGTSIRDLIAFKLRQEVKPSLDKPDVDSPSIITNTGIKTTTENR